MMLLYRVTFPASYGAFGLKFCMRKRLHKKNMSPAAGTPPDTKHGFFVLQHTESDAGVMFLLSGMVYSNGSAVSLLS